MNDGYWVGDVKVEVNIENRRDKFRAFEISCFRDENKLCHVEPER